MSAPAPHDPTAGNEAWTRIREVLDERGWLIAHGDCLSWMHFLPDCSIDAVVTDPPAGIGFMAKEWDDFGGRDRFVEWLAERLRECLRVLKPGGHALVWALPRTSHWTATAIEEAGFEIRDRVSHLFGCLSDDTLALTRRGWLRYDALTDEDEVLQWDSATGTLSWARPLERMVYDYAGPMVRLVNRHTDQALTPNHRVYCKVEGDTFQRGTHPEWRVFRADALRHGYQITLPMAGELKGSVEADPQYAYLVGWWLTDAWTHGDGKAVMFSQAKRATLEKLRDALAPHQPSEYVKKAKAVQHNDEHTFYVTGPLADRLLREHPDRKLTWAMLDWKLAARRRLFDGLMDGDGSRPREQYAQAFWSKDEERRAIFLALALSLGFRAYDDAENFCVHVNVARDTTQLQAKNRVEPEHYEGKVWCVRVPTGAFVAMRNGRPFITGNSGFPKSLDVSKAIDKAAGVERPVVGVNPRAAQQTGQENTPAYGDRRPHLVLTGPGSAHAELFDGYGTALKPACEDWWLCRKPLEGTVAQNVIEWGTGGLNIDGCRVATSENLSGGAYSGGARPTSWAGNTGEAGGKSSFVEAGGGRLEPEDFKQPPGRWPAHLVLSHTEGCTLLGTRKVKSDSPTQDRIGQGQDGARTNGIYGAKVGKVMSGYADADGTETVEAWDCTPDCPVRMLDEQSGAAGARAPVRGDEPSAAVEQGAAALNPRKRVPGQFHKDKGGASRFFYVAKASRSEREAGLEHLPKKSGAEAVDREEGSAGLQSPRAGAGRTGGRLYSPGEIPVPSAEWVNEVLAQALLADTALSITRATVGSTIQLEDGTWWSKCWCGSPCTDPSLPAIRSTIETRISSTIDRRTWSCSPRLHTNGCIAAAFGAMALGGSPASCAAGRSQSTESTGISAPKDGRSTDGVESAMSLASWLTAEPERPRVRKGIKNTHCTVKSLDLMRWLVRLVLPPVGSVRGGRPLILDPFAGSGSTVGAALLEECYAIGIESDPESVPIARGRAEHWAKQARWLAPAEDEVEIG